MLLMRSLYVIFALLNTNDVAGVSAEFGVIMLPYLKTAWKQRIAAPMMGGMITAPLLSMFVVPAAYLLMRRRRNQPETTTRHTLPV